MLENNKYNYYILQFIQPKSIKNTKNKKKLVIINGKTKML